MESELLRNTGLVQNLLDVTPTLVLAWISLEMCDWLCDGAGDISGWALPRSSPHAQRWRKRGHCGPRYNSATLIYAIEDTVVFYQCCGSDGSDPIKRERGEGNFHVFSIESIVFCDQKIDSILKKIESIPSIFFKDRRDRFDNGQFFKDQKIIRSKIERAKDRIAKDRNSEISKDRIPVICKLANKQKKFVLL